MQPNIMPAALEIAAAVNPQPTKPAGKTGAGLADKTGNLFGNFLQAAVAEKTGPEARDAGQGSIPDNQGPVAFAADLWAMWGALPVRQTVADPAAIAPDAVAGANFGANAAAALPGSLTAPAVQLVRLLPADASPVAPAAAEGQNGQGQPGFVLSGPPTPQTASVEQGQALTAEQLAALLAEAEPAAAKTAAAKTVAAQPPPDLPAARRPELPAQPESGPAVQPHGVAMPAVAPGKVNPGPVTPTANSAETAAAAIVQPAAAASAEGHAGASGQGVFAEAGDFAAQAEPAAPKADSPPALNFAAALDQHSAKTVVAAGSGSEAAPPPPADPHNIAGQIVEQARLFARANNSEMVIRLKPEHLGELTLKVIVENGAVSATFHSANAEVRAIVEASLPQLRQDMSGQGLKLDHVGVYASLDQFFSNDQRQSAGQQALLRNAARNRQGDDREFAEAVEAAAVPAAQIGATGIDYRV